MNGIEDATPKAVVGAIRNTTGILAIGRAGSTSSEYFNGTIDDVKLWNRALAADEVLSEYNGGRSGETLSAATNITGLVGWWKFNEGSGSSTADDSMREYGQYIGAMRLDGVNDYADAGNSQVLNITNAITVSAWVKFNRLDYTGNTGALLGIAGKGHPDAVAPNGGWWFSYDNRNNGQRFVYTCFGNSAGGYSGGGNNFGAASYNYIFSTGTFYHIAFTVTQTEAKLYINGAQHGPAKTLVNLNLSDTGRSLLIGRLSGGSYFNGTIDEVMVFNRSLSTEEVAALYETSKKKISGAGGSQSIGVKTPTPAVVLSNPAGTTKFDSVEVTDSSSKLTLLIPYSAADINGTLRAAKGEHQVEVRNMGVSAATGRPVVQLTAS